MKKNIALLLISSLFILALNSCKLTDSSTTPPSAAFFVIHASPNAPNADVILNGGLYVQNFAYGSDSGYIFVPSGTYNLKVAAPSGSSNYAIDANTTFEAGKYYSIFAIDSASKLKAAIVQDALSIPGTDSVRVRFFQFSPDAPYLNAKLKNSVTLDSLLYSGRSFNDQGNSGTLTEFKTIKAGTYNLDLSTPGSGTPFKSFTNIVFTSGRSYTVYLKGFYGVTTGAQALDKGIVENVQ